MPNLIICNNLHQADSVQWSALPLHQLPERWQTSPSPFSLEYKCALTEEALLLEIVAHSSVPRPVAQQARSQQCIEGLWNGDVAELFLVDASGCYQEFNFSFDGAWWTAAFSHYRHRITPQPQIACPQISFTQTPTRQTLSIAIGQPSLWLALPTRQNLRLNLCAILGAPQSYFSAYAIPTSQPDFHRLEQLPHALS